MSVIEVTLTVAMQDWQAIIAGLNELPRKLSEPVIQKLVAQVNKQIAAASAPLDEAANDVQPNG